MNQQKKIVYYIVLILSLFAKDKNVSLKEASLYLDKYGGIKFLMDYYSAEHLLSLDEVLEDVSYVCKGNGGVL